MEGQFQHKSCCSVTDLCMLWGKNRTCPYNCGFQLLGTAGEQISTSGDIQSSEGTASSQTKHWTCIPNTHLRCPPGSCNLLCGLLSRAGQALSLLQWPQAQDTQPLTILVPSLSQQAPS